MLPLSSQAQPRDLKSRTQCNLRGLRSFDSPCWLAQDDTTGAVYSGCNFGPPRRRPLRSEFWFITVEEGLAPPANRVFSLAPPSGRGAPVRTLGRRGPGRKSLPLDKGRCPEGAEGSKSKGPIDPPPPSAEPPLRKGAFETVGADILHDEIPSANASPERALRPLRVEVPAGRRGLAEQGAHRRRTNPSVRPTARQLSFQGRQGTSTPQTHAENRRRRSSAAVQVCGVYLA